MSHVTVQKATSISVCGSFLLSAVAYELFLVQNIAHLTSVHTSGMNHCHSLSAPVSSVTQGPAGYVTHSGSQDAQSQHT